MYNADDRWIYRRIYRCIGHIVQTYNWAGILRPLYGLLEGFLLVVFQQY
jgi:hypothetical protein